MNDVDSDIASARLVISNVTQKPTTFNKYSLVYKGTNENMNDDVYKDLLNSKRKMLTVIGSGDQVLNAIISGTKNIDAYDISVFPKYYLSLKIEAVKDLSLKGFIDFFYGEKPFNEKTFKKLCSGLSDEDKHFWSELCKDKKPEEVYKSLLFTCWTPSIEDIKFRNPYLQAKNYAYLKRNIGDIKIRYITKDIYDFVNNNPLDDYDVINLSNICMYCDEKFFSSRENQYAGSIKGYGNFVRNLNINDGVVINYLINVDSNWFSNNFATEAFVGDGFSFHKIAGNTKSRVDGISVYKKEKKYV